MSDVFANRLSPTSRPKLTPGMRLVCLPPAGGGVDIYSTWPERLPAAEVSTVNPPGSVGRTREMPLQTVTDAASAIATAISIAPAYPTVLFGHGLGALIAFEAARRLTERSWPLLALFVSGQRAPSMPGAAEGLSGLDDDALVAELRRRYGTPATVFTERDDDLSLPLVRSDIVMLENYRYEAGTRLSCPIVACAGAGDVQARAEDMDAWRLETTNRFAMRMFAGGSRYLQQEVVGVTGYIANQLSVILSAMARPVAVR